MCVYFLFLFFRLFLTSFVSSASFVFSFLPFLSFSSFVVSFSFTFTSSVSPAFSRLFLLFYLPSFFSSSAPFVFSVSLVFLLPLPPLPLLFKSPVNFVCSRYLSQLMSLLSPSFVPKPGQS